MLSIGIVLPGAPRSERKKLAYQARKAIDTGGFNVVLPMLKAWPRDASMAAISEQFRGVGHRDVEELDRMLASAELPDHRRIVLTLMKAGLSSTRASQIGPRMSWTRPGHGSSRTTHMAEQWLYTVIYLQGVTALRRGENDNCIDVPGRQLLHPSHRPGGRPHQADRARGWRSAISPSTSSSSPTTWRSAGC